MQQLCDLGVCLAVTQQTENLQLAFRQAGSDQARLSGRRVSLRFWQRCVGGLLPWEHGLELRGKAPISARQEAAWRAFADALLAVTRTLGTTDLEMRRQFADRAPSLS